MGHYFPPIGPLKKRHDSWDRVCGSHIDCEKRIRAVAKILTHRINVTFVRLDQGSLLERVKFADVIDELCRFEHPALMVVGKDLKVVGSRQSALANKLGREPGQ